MSTHNKLTRMLYIDLRLLYIYAYDICNLNIVHGLAIYELNLKYIKLIVLKGTPLVSLALNYWCDLRSSTQVFFFLLVVVPDVEKTIEISFNFQPIPNQKICIKKLLTTQKTSY